MSPTLPLLYKRVTAGVPLLVTVIVHIVLIGVAAYFVSEKIIKPADAFEARSTTTETPQTKQLEYKLRVARSPGGASKSSPVDASRIISTATDALQLPTMPDLPSSGASVMSAGGFGNGGIGGPGMGDHTALGKVNGIGTGFMPLTFLDVTNQRTNKVAFVVDISPALMDIRKGGFRAFEILRAEISRLVSTLPPANQFNVVLFDGSSVRLFANELKPATVDNKTEFIKWMAPINADLASLGGRSIPATSPRWHYKPDDTLKLDPEYGPAPWVHAIHAALEQKPDTVFVVTGSSGAGQIRLSEETVARQRRQREQQLADLKRQGYDLEAVNAARGKALAKLRTELDEINRKLIAQKKDPFVVTENHRVLASDFQAALRRAGFPPLKLDTSGWSDKQGNPIWFSTHVGTTRNAEFAEAIGHISKLQYGLLRGNASLNIFLFTGPDEKPEGAKKNLSSLSSRNGGKFSLLTTKRLEEIARKANVDL
jgi:hypothetical protein